MGVLGEVVVFVLMRREGDERKKEKEEEKKEGRGGRSSKRSRRFPLFLKFCSFFFGFGLRIFSRRHRTSEYLLVIHEPRASMTGIEVKFSEAMSSIPVLFEECGGEEVEERRGAC